MNPKKSAVNNLSMARTQVIDSMIRVSDYYNKEKHGFADQLKMYGIPRAKLAILKQFAVNKRKDLYQELVKSEEYEQYKISSLIHYPDLKIKLVSALYSISPSTCYLLLSLI